MDGLSCFPLGWYGQRVYLRFRPARPVPKDDYRFSQVPGIRGTCFEGEE